MTWISWGGRCPIGNFVSQSGIGGLITSVTNTYAPYIEVGDEAYSVSQDQIIRGTDYQEVLSSFPLGNQVLTGLFLDITLSGAGTTTQAYQRPLVDRIGYVARQEGVALSISVNPTDPSVLNDLDIYTLNLVPGLANPNPSAAIASDFSNIDKRLQSLTGVNLAQLGSDAVTTLRQAVITATRGLADKFLKASDTQTNELASIGLVKAYVDKPRIIITSHNATTDPTTLHTTFAFEMDLRADAERTLAFPGQNQTSAVAFNILRGIAESVEEGNAIVLVAQSSQPISIATVFGAAQVQGIGVTVITTATLNTLDSLSISAEAKLRITHAVEQGNLVIVPRQEVNIKGQSTVGWYEIDPVSGHTVGVLGNGNHGGNAENSGLTLAQTYLIYIGASFVVAFAGVGIFRTFFDSYGDASAWFKAIKPPDLSKFSDNLNDAVASLAKANSNLFVLGYVFIATTLIYLLSRRDPPVEGNIWDILAPEGQSNVSTAALSISGGNSAGMLQGSVSVPSISVSNQLSPSWTSSAADAFLVNSLGVPNALVRDGNGQLVGSGSVALSASDLLPVSVSGNVGYNVDGVGKLSFYTPAAMGLAVSGDWDRYKATLSGQVSLQLTTDQLTINGNPLPAGSYTISTSSATLTGSGLMTSPDFAGSASISVSGATVYLGPGTGNITVGGHPLDPAQGVTLAGYTGSLSVTANGNNTDAVSLNGSAADVLQVSANSGAITTDQNTPVTFQPEISTSLADTYTLTAQGPPEWTVNVNDNGSVTVTLAPGLQGGTYAIQITAQSTTNPDLVAQTLVNVTVAPTQPGLTLSVVPDSQFTVPFHGAELPTGFRAVIHNNGPATDTFNLTFTNLSSGFTVAASGSGVTVPAGQTGIVGIYLQPTDQLPPPGTLFSFDVTATSASNPAITQTQTVTFTVPAIDAATLSSNPTVLNTTPAASVTDALAVQNVGNVPENVALSANTPSGLTLTGLPPTVSLGVGQSVNQTITLTPAADTPLNSTLTATISYATALPQDVVSVIQVSPTPSSVEAGQSLDVSATVFAGVSQPRPALASYVVKDSSGAVLFTSPSVPVQLTSVAATTAVDLGHLETTSLASGAYTIEVTVTEQNGQPIAGATGQGTLLIDSVLTAGLTLATTSEPPGNATVTTTLEIDSHVPAPSVVATVPVPGAGGIAQNGNLLYVSAPPTASGCTTSPSPPPPCCCAPSVRVPLSCASTATSSSRCKASAVSSSRSIR